MADMTVDEAMEKYGPSELSRDDLLVLDDSGYVSENVAIVTGGAQGSGGRLHSHSRRTDSLSLRRTVTETDSQT